MKIPIRMIGIATTLFWIFLIAFFISAVYSVKDVEFNFGEPEIHLTSVNETLISIPISIYNHGYYRISSFNLTTQISDKDGSTITQGSTFIPVIQRGTEIRATHNMTLDVGDLIENNREYLFNDTELIVHEILGLELAGVIPVRVSTNLSVPWGAPLSNFGLGEIDYSVLNESHLITSIPIGFENHAFFDLLGNIQIDMYNGSNILLGSGQATVQASQGSEYEGEVELTVPIVDLTENGHCEVYISNEFFDFGPLVVSYD